MPYLLPQGFQAAGHACGIKNDPATLDLALFVSDTPAAAAGVFTQNRVCGAPVKVSRARLPSAGVRSVVINSGNANACTGQRGYDDAQWMTGEVARLIGCPGRDVLVCSTGLIGHLLPRPKLEAGIPAVFEKLAATPAAFADAARAMMTTDTVPKQCVREIELNGKPVRVSGAAKGAAMIGPNMATMLATIMTDAELTPVQADFVLHRAVDVTFNRISVEGHTSTSDSVILLANGAAQAGPVDSELPVLQDAVTQVCRELAMAIIRDAEGAGHFVTLDVSGLTNSRDAEQIARTVANDALVKAAIAGNDPNWGRIVSCCGRTGVELTEDDITLRINGTTIFQRGTPVDYDEAALSESMRSERDVLVELTIDQHGRESVRFWTSDLTQEYVRLNSEYTT